MSIKCAKEQYYTLLPSSMEKNFHDQAMHADIKRYEEMRKLTTGQGEDYTRGCLLDYDYIKNQCRLITVDLSRQNELGADLEGIQN